MALGVRLDHGVIGAGTGAAVDAVAGDGVGADGGKDGCKGCSDNGEVLHLAREIEIRVRRCGFGWKPGWLKRNFLWADHTIYRH